MTGAIPPMPKSGGTWPSSEGAFGWTRMNATKYIAMPARTPCAGAGDQRGGKSAKTPHPTAISNAKTRIQDGRMASPAHPFQETNAQ